MRSSQSNRKPSVEAFRLLPSRIDLELLGLCLLLLVVIGGHRFPIPNDEGGHRSASKTQLINERLDP